jgi:hypothetical protein
MITALIISLLAILILIFKTRAFKRKFLIEVARGYARTSKSNRELLTEKDLIHLPAQVQKYLRYVGVTGKDKVINVTIHFDGVMQDKHKPIFRIKAEQTSFFDVPTRLFYLKGLMMGLPVKALHKYMNAHAAFEVKPLALFHIVNEKEGNLNIAETVTFFNDMCLLAPATLIDPAIKWEETGPKTVQAKFTCNEITITANLVFNDEGQLVNFSSDDRYYLNSKNNLERMRWTTPARDYKDYNGYRLASYAEAVWSFPEGDFCYAKFNLTEVTYNSGIDE